MSTSDTNALSGMKDIRDYCRSIQLASSEASVLMMIQSYGFPARKIGGIWESNKESINNWRKQFVEGKIGPKQQDKKPEA